MKAKEKYIRETGDMEPNGQIAYLEWHQRYVAWLEKQVEQPKQIDLGEYLIDIEYVKDDCLMVSIFDELGDLFETINISNVKDE